MARMGERIVACRILVGRPEGKSRLGIRRRRWECIIKMDLKEVGWGLRIGAGGGFLWMTRICSLAEVLLISQEGLCSMESVCLLIS